MKDYLIKWEPVDIILLFAMIGLMGLIASGLDGVLKGALATIVMYSSKRATGIAVKTKRSNKNGV